MRSNFHIGLVMLIFFIISFITNILNSILSDVRTSYELSLSMTGLLPFSFFIAYGVMSIPAGVWVEKYREKLVLTASFVLITLSSLLFSLLPAYQMFLITLFALGCSMAALQVVINPLLRTAGGEENFAFYSVLAQLAFGGASFLSPYLYQYLVSSDQNDGLALTLRGFFPVDLPWASLYLIFALTALIMIAVVYFSKYPKVELKEDEKAGSRDTYVSLLKNKTVLLFLLGIVCYVGTEQGVGNWISQFLMEYHGQDPQTVGATVVSNFWGMLTVGCFAGLLLLKLMDSKKVLIVFSIAAMVSLVFALTGSVDVAKIAFPVVGFCISVMWSIIFSLGMNSMADHHGSVSGILCSGIAGGAIVPLIIGWLGEVFGLNVGMLFLFITLAYILSIGFWAKPIITNKTLSKN